MKLYIVTTRLLALLRMSDSKGKCATCRQDVQIGDNVVSVKKVGHGGKSLRHRLCYTDAKGEPIY